MRRTSRNNPLVQHGPSKVYIDPDFGELVELVQSRPETLRFVVGKDHYGVASGYGSTHTHISAALRSMFGSSVDGYTLILNTDASYPMEESEWTMHPRVHGITADNYASFSAGVDALPVQVQRDLEDMRKIWTDVYGEDIQRKAMRRSMREAARNNPRRNPEGERHTSLKEQAESALLWERIRNAKSRKEALAHYRAALLAAENEQRLLRDRKKAGKGRKPKPVYTKEYLTKKGMPRRNPFEMFRRPGDLFSVSIPFTTSTPLSVEFSKTDPGEQRRFRLLPNSPKEAGWLKPIIGKWLSADDALDLAVEAEGLSKNMYSSYPRHEYRDAARFYEGMSVVFFGLAEAVQTPWGR